MASTERNEEAPYSAPLGAMGSVLGRLEDMGRSTDDGGSVLELEGQIHFISEMLKKLSDVQDPPLTANYWMKHARELSYDIDAYLDDFPDAKKEDNPDSSDAKVEENPNDSDAKMEENPNDSDAKTGNTIDDSDDEAEDSIEDSDDEVEDSVDDSDGSMKDSTTGSDYRISGFSTRAKGMIDRYERFSLDSVLSCPTAATTIASPRTSRDLVLVGMGNHIRELISLLKPKDQNDNELKIVSILGDEGIGKSTLIQEIWRESFKEQKIWHELESEVNIKRAFVRMGKKPDATMILRSILSQVSQQEPDKNSVVTDLIRDIRKHLEQKRYFIILDDVRSLSVWDVVGRAFPRCNFGSRIITTTSDKEVALACCSYVREHKYSMEPLTVDDCKELFIRTISFRSVNLQLSNKVLDEVKRKCGGLPLAIIWTAILVGSKLETEQGLSRSEKEQNLGSEVKKFLDENLRTGSTPVEILTQLLKLCYSSLPHYLKTCLLYLSVYPENKFFLKQDLVKLWIAEDFVCTSEKDKDEAAGRYFDVLVSLGLIQRMNINGNKQHHQGEVDVVEDEKEDSLRLRVPYVVHPTVFDFIICKSIEDNFITIIDNSQSTAEFKDKIRRLSLQFGSATYASTPAGLSQVRTLSFMGLVGCMPSLVEFKIVRVMMLDLWADDKDTIFSLTEICKLLLLKYLQVSCNVTVKLPGKMGCLKLLETLEVNSRVTAVPSDISNLPKLSYVRFGVKTSLERVPQHVEHSCSHMAPQTTEVNPDPTLIEPVNEKDEVPVTCGTRAYYTTDQNLDTMPVKDTKEHADWGMPQVSDVTQDDSAPQQKSGMDSRAFTFDDYRKQLEMVLEDPTEEPVPVSLDFLKDITDGFSSDRLIGRGGFGEVYRGVLGSDKSIAIKKLYAEHVVDEGKYNAEVGSLLSIRHQNIVLLIGYCAETKLQAVRHNGRSVLADVRERLLCFEYISNGSLSDLIPKLQISENEDIQDLLGWDTRYAIIEGICRGLAFLHEECKLTHMDLTPQNILMDSNMVPKITDFGLSRSRPEDAEKSVIFTQTLTGTLGYLPPEFLLEGKISLKTDIYSLGVIMCQIITGKKVQQSMKFTEKACRRWMEIFDKSLNDASLKETYIKQVKQLLDIALKCVDNDRMKRPSSSEILKVVFDQNPAERSSSKLDSKYGQARELLSVHPPQLDFCLTESEKLHRSPPCLLHLTNNIHIPVAFRLMPSETLAAHFRPRSGVVPPKCRYTLAVIMRPQRNATFGIDGFFTLESTKERAVEGLRSVNDPEKIFERATERGFKVHEVKLGFVCAHTEVPTAGPNLKPELTQRVSWDGQDKKHGLMIIPTNGSRNSWYYGRLYVHPTEPWFLLNRYTGDGNEIVVWDYLRLKKVHFHLGGTPSKRANESHDDADGHLLLPGTPIFISRKRWILVGSGGYINVYSYMAVRNFKGSKTYLVSKVKSLKAYDDISSHVILDVHQSRPYVLSTLINKGYRDESDQFNPVVANIIKLWDWENGWNCVKTFNAEEAIEAKFNPKDQDTFFTISQEGVVKVWNIDSPECKYTFPTTGIDPRRSVDFFTQGGKQYLIIVDERDNCTIWDYNSGTPVETLKGNMRVACSHPELPVLITGSGNRNTRGSHDDGRVLLWSSSTFSLVGALDCGLGGVQGVVGVKGSGRIIIDHQFGIAIAEIGHFLESERPHESEESKIKTDKDKTG